MNNRNNISDQLSLESLPTRAAVARCLLSSVFCLAPSGALAAFVTFNGGVGAETTWQTAAAPTLLEDFESYANGTQIQSLPSLHLAFDELAGGGYPQAYPFGGTPHGPMQLGNFPNGINAINRYDDTIARPTAGFTLQALAFWNGDGQNDTLVAFAYDSAGQLLGSVGALKGTFAGFTSDVPVAWVRFEGDTGDGWNHLDGLQVGVRANAIPEPGSHLLMTIGALALATTLRRKPRTPLSEISAKDA